MHTGFNRKTCREEITLGT